MPSGSHDKPEEMKNKLRQPTAGRKHTLETRKKMSELHRGKPYLFYWKGKKFSQEHKEKIAQGNKGKKRSPETREKIRLARLRVTWRAA